MRRGIATIDDLRARSQFDKATMCWHWTGAKSPEGQPRMHAFCHAKSDKRTMSCCTAVWNIAFGESPRGIPFHTCGAFDCVNPAHLKLAHSMGEINAYRASAGFLKGTAAEARRACAKAARALNGVVEMTDEQVARIRGEWAGRPAHEIALELGRSVQSIVRCRMGQTYRQVSPAGGGA